MLKGSREANPYSSPCTPQIHIYIYTYANLYLCVYIYVTRMSATWRVRASSASSNPGLAGRLERPGRGGTVFASGTDPQKCGGLGLRPWRVQKPRHHTFVQSGYLVPASSPVKPKPLSDFSSCCVNLRFVNEVQCDDMRSKTLLLPLSRFATGSRTRFPCLPTDPDCRLRCWTFCNCPLAQTGNLLYGPLNNPLTTVMSKRREEIVSTHRLTWYSPK